MEAARAGGAAAFPVFIGAAQGLARLGDAGGLDALREEAMRRSLDRAPIPLDSPREDWDGPEAILGMAGDGPFRGRLLRQAAEGERAAAAAAVRLLREYPASPEVLGGFLAALERPEWEPILEALDALRAAGSPDALPRALAALRSPETDRRYAAALALGRFRDRSTAKDLGERLAVEPDPSVARKICDALGLVADPSSAPALVAFLRRETAPTPDRALLAFEARQNLRGPLAAAAAGDLARLVEGKDTPPAIRFHAARALGQAPAGEGPRRALEGLLREGDPGLRAAAADALGDLGDLGARDALAQAYAREPEETVAGALRDAILRLDLGSPVGR
ncbi:MAG: HEAT repeat domain-containing protein [Planctomycetes bacterium]|nr:HEAT repeat domain-containing protein [Planctomycetota bacterium]